MRVQVVSAPTVISTFAGCGGSSLGYKLAGFHELLAVEWDDNAVETFRLNFPGVPVYHGDIGKLTGAECMKLAGVKVGELDVFDGSPPCQGFSTAGKRKFDDPRNSLFKEFARLLVELQPKVFVMENVTGMVKGCMKQAYLTIIATLRDCGYVCKGEVLNAMYFNVPQSRERVIIIGVRNDLEIFPSHPKPQTRPVTVREALRGLSTTEPDATLGHCWIPAKPESKTMRALMITKPGDKLHGFTMSRRLAWDEVCGTIQTGGVAPGYPGSSWPSHPQEHRGISMREAARLASFPDSFAFTDWRAGCKRIGNSVPPILMRAIAEHVRKEILDKCPP
jgi:DNA (cytosine-5)-methyltransferase 1